MRQVDHHKQFEMFSTFFCVKKRATKLNILKRIPCVKLTCAQHHNVSFRNESQFYSHSWLWNPTAKHIVDGRKPANHLRLLVYPRYFKTSINRPESPRGASVHWKFVPRQVETLRHLDQKTVEASKKSTWFFSGRVIVFSENRFKTKKCPCFDG